MKSSLESNSLARSELYSIGYKCEAAIKTKELSMKADDAAKRAKKAANMANEAARRASKAARSAIEARKAVRNSFEVFRSVEEAVRKADEAVKKAGEVVRSVAEAAKKFECNCSNPREELIQSFPISSQLADHEEEKEAAQYLKSQQISWNISDWFYYPKWLPEWNSQKCRKVVYQAGMSPELCTVCIEAFKINELVHKLPCDHLFHPICITEWLRRNAKCPLCQLNI